MADDGERPGQEQRRADPLHHPRGDQDRGARRQAAGQRAAAEDDEPGEDDSLVAAKVADRSAGEHQRGEGEGVAVDDPLKPADARPDARADTRQGDVDDRHVEEDEEVPDAHHRQHGAGRARTHASGRAPRQRDDGARHSRSPTRCRTG